MDCTRAPNAVRNVPVLLLYDGTYRRVEIKKKNVSHVHVYLLVFAHTMHFVVSPVLSGYMLRIDTRARASDSTADLVHSVCACTAAVCLLQKIRVFAFSRMCQTI